MQSVPATAPLRRPRSRRLAIIAQGPCGHHERLELLVTPGMRVAELGLDEPSVTLIQPGGGVLVADDDLFKIAADTPSSSPSATHLSGFLNRRPAGSMLPC
jgi:hypothetical protein